MKTTLIYTKQENNTLVQAGNGLWGYRVDFTVTEAANISPKIFIMQREVPVVGQDVFVDSFYSVASAAQMELPEIGSLDDPFHRTNTISLIFPNPADLRLYSDSIEEMIGQLVKANDAILSMLPAQTVGVPDTTLARFWGLVSAHAVTDQDLEARGVDHVFSKTLAKTLTNDAGPRYVYVAIRSDLADITALKLNTVGAAFAKTTRAYENPAGYTHDYKIFLTNATTSASTIVLETT